MVKIGKRYQNSINKREAELLRTSPLISEFIRIVKGRTRDEIFLITNEFTDFFDKLEKTDENIFLYQVLKTKLNLIYLKGKKKSAVSYWGYNSYEQ